MSNELTSRHFCPCCGSLVEGEAGAYTICPRCQWEDDPVQAKDPGFAGGANALSLREARRNWAAAHPRRQVKHRRFGRGRN